MSHQITKLITRISVLLPELRCLRLLCQQVLGNAQPEQSAPQLPTEVKTTHRPAQPPAARRDTHQASPTHTEQSLLPRAPGCALCGEKLVSVLSEETSRQRTAPERHSFLPFCSKLQGHACPEIHSCRDLLCTALAGLPLLSGQREGPMSWSFIPMKPPCPSPQTAAFNVVNKHNHHVLIASLKAPSSFCSWGHKLLKLVWSESMIQHENSFFTQSPGFSMKIHSSHRAQLSLPGIPRKASEPGLAAMEAALYQAPDLPGSQLQPCLVVFPPGKLQW